MMPNIKRGRMSDAEKAEIERLATELEKPTPGRIARRLNRHPATVASFMIRRGLIERTVRYAPSAFKRGNRYSPTEDRRLVALRQAGLVCREIAETLTREFGHPRSTHSVHVRLAMLAAYSGGPESEAA